MSALRLTSQRRSSSVGHHDSEGDFAEFIVVLDWALRGKSEHKSFGLGYPALDGWIISSDIRPVEEQRGFSRSQLL